MLNREPRFPGIDWWCDNCDALLNDQRGFDDHKYVWKCTKCGYKNSISADAICYGNTKTIDFWGCLLGWFRSFNISVLITLILVYFYKFDNTLLRFIVENKKYVIVTYIILQIVSMIFEKGIAKYCADMHFFKYIITTPFINIAMDIIRPIIEVMGALKALLLRVFAEEYSYFSKRIIYGIIYLPIAVYLLLIVYKAFNYII